MRIALIPELFHPYVYGGVERRYYEIAKRLAKRHEVHVFAIGPRDRPTQEIVDGIIVHRVLRFPKEALYEDGSTRRLGPPILYAASLLKKLFCKYRFDVVDCSIFPYLHIFPSRALASIWRAPLVLTVHEVWGDYWRSYANNWCVAMVGMIVERLSFELPHCFVCVSGVTARNLVRYLGQKAVGRVFIVPNGVSLEYAKARGVQRFLEKAKRQVKEIVFAGRLIEHKRVDVLLEAFSRLYNRNPNLRLKIIGDGPLREPLRKLAKNLGVLDAVEFLGELPHDEFLRVVADSYVFAFPSVREGFAISVMEAMSVGTPPIVVSHRNNGALDYVRNGVNGLVVEPNNPEALAEGIAYLIEGVGAEEYARICKSCLQTAMSYSWERVVELLERIYRFVISC